MYNHLDKIKTLLKNELFTILTAVFSKVQIIDQILLSTYEIKVFLLFEQQLLFESRISLVEGSP